MELLTKCQKIRDQLIKFLEERPKKEYDPEEFLNKNPLAPLIGTICDEQIKSEVAWEIPEELAKWMQQEGMEFKASNVGSLGKEKLKNWLEKYMQDKWPRRMKREKREKWLDKISEDIILTCQKISNEYNDDPDNIFIPPTKEIMSNGIIELPVPHVYFVLRQFDGIGKKKASMIARDFGKGCDWLNSINSRLKNKGIEIKVTQAHFTEMPIDVHVRKVLRRLGFLRRYNEPQDIQNLARMIFPENPGLVDDLIWRVGRKFCKTEPNCEKCPLTEVCDKDFSKETVKFP
ncbi:MAG: hypothetical protein QW356_04120 [Candidatus Hadarchaeales archaeon]